ncbi:sensor histidine kinase [Brevibacillus reuszeri]|uniref:sensor histidine kinase n=1 Tax=Brevibacillus reuszeri TaxID=54915 RepID=UPI00289F92CE|nr:histidine kinase [Brevibacillus reuszeri]
MIRLLKEIRLVMYFFQWVLLLAFFFFYLDEPTWNYGLLMIFVIVCSLYIVILCYAIPERSWFLLGLVDMAIALFFIVQTGKWSSPFMLYVYTTMLWLMIVLRIEQVLFILGSFFLAASLLPEYHSFGMILPPTKLDQLRLLLDITIWISVIFVSLTLLRMMKLLYAKCFHLYLFMRKVASVPELNLCAYTEQMIRRVYRCEQAYLCLYQENDVDGEWKREYFLNTLLDAGAQEWKRLSIRQFVDYAGQEDTYACMPLRLDGETWGWLIFSLSSKNGLNRVDRLLLKGVAAIVCQQRKQSRARYELAQSLHKEMRKKLAQDMHDGLAQQLFFLSAQLFQLKRSMPAEVTKQLTERLELIEERVKWCHQEVRQTITHLREFRESEQITEAIEQLLERMVAGSNLQIRFSAKGHAIDEDLQVQDAIYRLVEEAAANVVKHAQAQSLFVSMEASSLQVKVRIKDDGIGFLPEEESGEKTFGVIGMKERIMQVGGTFQIRSQPDAGTEVLAIIPRRGVERYG